MATSEIPFTLAMWNALLTDINALAVAPPSGCTQAPVLDLATGDHRLSVADIEDVRITLSIICPDNVFTPLGDDPKWLVTTINEIEDAIDFGWCGCETVACEGDNIQSLSGIVETNTTFFNVSVLRDGVATTESARGSDIVINDAIDGMVVFSEGFSNVRTWALVKVYETLTLFSDEVSPYTLELITSTTVEEDHRVRTITGGSVQGDGTISYPSSTPLFGSGNIVNAVDGPEPGADYQDWGSYEVRGYCTTLTLDDDEVAGGSPTGTVVGNLTWSNPDANIELVDTDGGPFELVLNELRTTGPVSAPNSYILTFTIQMGFSPTVQRFFTVHVV